MSKRRAGVLGGAGLLTVAIMCSPAKGLAYDALQDTTPSTTLSTAYKNAYGVETSVYCMSQWEIQARTWPLGANTERINGYTVALAGTIWLDTDVCDNIVRFAESDRKQLVDGDEVYALGVAAHEGAHRTEWTVDESIAQCEAIQMVGAFATALGADEKVALAVRERYAEMVVKNEADTISAHPIRVSTPAQYALKHCYDGGPYDLEPDAAGFFPQTE